MKHYQSFILLALLMVNCYGAPVENVEEEDPELTGGYFEGDIILDGSRNGELDEAKRWPDGIVHYKIGSEFDDEHKDYILEAMESIENVSCIQFKPAKKDSKVYLNITGTGSGCNAVIGFRNKIQKLNLQIFELKQGCFRFGSIQHELLHTLGFVHQHSAPERDDFVEIVWDNILEGKSGNFNKHSNNTVTNFGVTYDYGSIMHYGPKAFSKNKEATIIPLKEEGAEIGQRRGLSDKDIEKLNLMYKCEDKSE